MMNHVGMPYQFYWETLAYRHSCSTSLFPRTFGTTLKMMKNFDPSTPIWQLTIGEFMELINQVQTVTTDNTPKEKRFVYGIAGIAQIFNCSMTTANRIKASGKINRAISQCGRMITIDADLALELMKK
jgi:hypothetical protein